MSLNRLCLVLNANYEAIKQRAARPDPRVQGRGRGAGGVCIHHSHGEEQRAGADRRAPDEIPADAAAEPGRFPQGDLAPGWQRLPVLRHKAALRQPDARSRGSAIETRAVDLGESGGLLFPCNNHKGNRTPQEAGMALARQPRQVSLHAKHKLLAADSQAWDKYLFA